MTEKLLKIEEAAERLGMAPYTVRKWLRAGKLRGVKTAPHQRGKWRVPESAVVEFVAFMPTNREKVDRIREAAKEAAQGE